MTPAPPPITIGIPLGPTTNETHCGDCPKQKKDHRTYTQYDCDQFHKRLVCGRRLPECLAATLPPKFDLSGL